MNRIDPSGTIFTASLRVLENQDSGTLAHPAGDLDISASLIAGARGFFPVRITISAQVLLGGIWTDVPVTGLIRGGQSGFSYGEETRYIEGGDLDTVRARIAGQVLENAACSGATELKLSVIVGQSSAAGMLGFFNTPAIFQASFSLKRHGIVGEQKSYTAAPPLQQWRGTQ